MICKHCGSEKVVKKGTSSLIHSRSQLYRCHTCKRTFSIKIEDNKVFKRKTEYGHVFLSAIVLASLGYSYTAIAKALNKNKSTISRWVKLAKDNKEEMGRIADDLQKIEPIRFRGAAKKIATIWRYRKDDASKSPDFSECLAMILRQPEDLKGLPTKDFLQYLFNDLALIEVKKPWNDPRTKADRYEEVVSKKIGLERYKKEEREAAVTAIRLQNLMHHIMSEYKGVQALQGKSESRKCYVEALEALKPTWKTSIKQVMYLYDHVDKIFGDQEKQVNWEYVLVFIEKHCEAMSNSSVTQMQWEQSIKRIIEHCSDPGLKDLFVAFLYHGMLNSHLDLRSLEEKLRPTDSRIVKQMRKEKVELLAKAGIGWESYLARERLWFER